MTQTIINDLGLNLTDENWLEACIKFLTALILSGAIGIERQRKGRGAGLRTHVLVCLGATLLMIVSEYIARTSGDELFRLDRARIAAGVITGIGFLGAGTIMKSGQEKVGLTTAAMVWFAAALGIAIGAGYLITALISTAFVLAVVIGLSAFEQVLPQQGYFMLSMQLPPAQADVAEILDNIEAAGSFEIITTAIKASEEGNRLQLAFQIKSKSSADFAVLAEVLRTRYAHAQKISLERLQL